MLNMLNHRRTNRIKTNRRKTNRRKTRRMIGGGRDCEFKCLCIRKKKPNYEYINEEDENGHCEQCGSGYIHQCSDSNDGHG